jgi:nicotinate-nucleotide pyrophosphorylase (carboxylating)
MEKKQVVDLRDKIFGSIADKSLTAYVVANDDGIIAETEVAAQEAERLGLIVEAILKEGTPVLKGNEIGRFRGTPKHIAMAEEVLMGLMAKPSGIATAMHRFIEKTGQKPQIVCGAWKKMPPPLKDSIRRAIKVGGGFFRITPEPFIYLDKNYIEMLGGVHKCLGAVSGLTGFVKVAQLKGRYKDISEEACMAIHHGAKIIFIDTGQKEDIRRVSDALNSLGIRDHVKIAFGGNVQLTDIEELKTMDIDLLDIGRAIVDAPLLDMRLEIA